MPPKSSKMVMFGKNLPLGKNFGGQYNINIKTCAQLHRVSKKLCIFVSVRTLLSNFHEF